MRIQVIACLYILLCAMPAFAQKKTLSEDELRKQSDKLFKAKDFVAAAPLYSQLLSVTNKDANYNYRYGVCLLEAAKDKSSSITYLDNAKKLGCIEDDLEFYLGRSLMYNSKYSDAVNSFKTFKEKAGEGKSIRYEIDLLISNCNNALELLKSRKNLVTLDRVETNRSAFYAALDFSNSNGKLIPAAEQYLSNIDKEKMVNPLMFINADSRFIIFSSYGKISIGKKDLYIVRKLDGGGWGNPENLGDAINTKEDEEYAYMAEDGRTLYFSSKGHNSMGGYDLFKSVLDLNTGRWSEAENLGIPVNTIDDDVYFLPTISGDIASVVSAMDAERGLVGIKRIKISTGNASLAVISGQYISQDQPFRRDAKISVIRVRDNGLVQTIKTDPRTGEYELQLPPGEDYMLLVQAGSYLPHAEIFTLPNGLTQTGLRQQLKLNRTSDEEEMVLANYFTAQPDAPMRDSIVAVSDIPSMVVKNKFDLAENDKNKLKPLKLRGQTLYVIPPANNQGKADLAFQNNAAGDEIKEVNVQENTLTKSESTNSAKENEIKSVDGGSTSQGLNTDTETNIAQEKKNLNDTGEKELALEESPSELKSMTNVVPSDSASVEAKYPENISNEDLVAVAYTDANEMESDAIEMQQLAKMKDQDASSKDSVSKVQLAEARELILKGKEFKDEAQLKFRESQETAKDAEAIRTEADELRVKAEEKKKDAVAARKDAGALAVSFNVDTTKVLAMVNAKTIENENTQSRIEGNTVAINDGTEPGSIIEDPSSVASNNEVAQNITPTSAENKTQTTIENKSEVAQNVTSLPTETKTQNSSENKNEVAQSTIPASAENKTQKAIENKNELASNTSPSSVENKTQNTVENKIELKNEVVDHTVSTSKENKTQITGEAKNELKSELASNTTPTSAENKVQNTIGNKNELKSELASNTTPTSTESKTQTTIEKKNEVAQNSASLPGETKTQNSSEDKNEVAQSTIPISAENKTQNIVENKSEVKSEVAENKIQNTIENKNELKNEVTRSTPPSVENKIENTADNNSERKSEIITAGRNEIARDETLLALNGSEPGRTSPESDMREMTASNVEVSSNLEEVIQSIDEPARESARKYVENNNESVTLERKSRSLQTKIEAMPQSQQRDSLIGVANDYSIQSVRKWQEAQQNLRTAQQNDGSVQLKLHELRNAQTSDVPVAYLDENNAENATEEIVESENDTLTKLDTTSALYPQYVQAKQDVESKQNVVIENFARGITWSNQAEEAKAKEIKLRQEAEVETDKRRKSDLLMQAELYKLQSDSLTFIATQELETSKALRGEVDVMKSNLQTLKEQITIVDTTVKPEQNLAASAKQSEGKSDTAKVAFTTSPATSMELNSNTEQKEIWWTDSVKQANKLQVDSAAIIARSADVKTEVAVTETAVDPNPSPVKEEDYTYNATLNEMSFGFEKQGRKAGEEISMDPSLPAGLVFKVQIGAFRKPVPASAYKNIQPLTAETSRPGWVRYCVGLFRTFEPANLVKKEMRISGFKDAFVVAYFNGKRISLAEAYSMLNITNAATKNVYTEVQRKESASLASLNIVPQKYKNIKDDDVVAFYGSTNNAKVSKLSSIASGSLSSVIEYTVQIGVYRSANPPSAISQFENLQSQSIRNGLYRFTSGRFSNRIDAEAARRSAVSAGVKDAFVTKYSAGNAVEASVAPTRVVLKSQPEPSASLLQNENSTPSSQETISSINKNGIVFKIQIGAFKENVPMDKVQSILKIASMGLSNEIDSRGLHIFYAGNFSNVADASSAKSEIVKSGIADAFIVAFSNGKKIPLADAIKAMQ